MDPETVYSSNWLPDATSALDVLAFVLTPVSAFANPDDHEEFEAVADLFGKAKAEAVARWFEMRATVGRNRS